jgi:hypothetical protein
MRIVKMCGGPAKGSIRKVIGIWGRDYVENGLIIDRLGIAIVWRAR